MAGIKKDKKYNDDETPFETNDGQDVHHNLLNGKDASDWD